MFTFLWNYLRFNYIHSRRFPFLYAIFYAPRTFTSYFAKKNMQLRAGEDFIIHTMPRLHNLVEVFFCVFDMWDGFVRGKAVSRHDFFRVPEICKSDCRLPISRARGICLEDILGGKEWNCFRYANKLNCVPLFMAKILPFKTLI